VLKILQWFQGLKRKSSVATLALGLVFSVILGLVISAPAWAEIHAYAQPGQSVMARSLHSVRDNRDRAWQAVFYKEVGPNQAVGLYLRLVGFPGMGYPQPAAPLRIVTGTEQVLELPNVSDQIPNLAANGGQYDMGGFMATIKRNPPLKLYLPIQNIRAESVLTVAPFVVQEWRQVANMELASPQEQKPEAILVGSIATLK
jgi:hypothetical protein